MRNSSLETLLVPFKAVGDRVSMRPYLIKRLPSDQNTRAFQEVSFDQTGTLLYPMAKFSLSRQRRSQI